MFPLIIEGHTDIYQFFDDNTETPTFRRSVSDKILKNGPDKMIATFYKKGPLEYTSVFEELITEV